MFKLSKVLFLVALLPPFGRRLLRRRLSLAIDFLGDSLVLALGIDFNRLPNRDLGIERLLRLRQCQHKEASDGQASLTSFFVTILFNSAMSARSCADNL